MNELIDELRKTERVCRDRMDGQVMLDAADAIERLQSELTEANGLIEKLTAETEHWKQAWWSAYKLYEEGKRKPYEPKRPN